MAANQWKDTNLVQIYPFLGGGLTRAHTTIIMPNLGQFGAYPLTKQLDKTFLQQWASKNANKYKFYRSFLGHK
jgi:hypothetical protein